MSSPEPQPSAQGDTQLPSQKGFFGSPLGKAIRNFVVMLVSVVGFVQALVFLFGEGDETKAFLLGLQKWTAIVLGYAIVVYGLYVWLEEPDL